MEATSGNTGVALAMVAAARGYKFVATMVETFSVERRKLMRAYGAKVILTPAAERGSGMVRKARELAEQHGWFLASQFANPANPAYHRNTTAAEILRDFAGKRLDYFVSGWGTGGTLTGVGEVLKVARPQTRIIATEPAGAALLKGDDWKPHKIRAGRRISCRTCSTAMWWMNWCRWRMTAPSPPHAGWLQKKASSSASPPALPWPARWTLRPVLNRAR